MIHLARLGVFDPVARAIDPESIPDSVYQRAKIQISKNPIKKRMLRDLLRGGTLPAVVTIETSDDGIEIADGLQRTHVLTVASLHSDEKLRLFMVLNVGQQKVSPRHLLEVAQGDLRDMFEDWGIGLLTEREDKEMPRRRGRPRKDAPAESTVGAAHYRYEFLIDSLQAYVTGDPHIDTRKMLEGEGLSDKFDARITEVGSEACRDDFKWVCLALNQRIRERYEGNAKWELAVQTSAPFLIPLFAALGKAREEADTGSTVQHHQQELLELLDQPGDDPLCLFSGPDSLDSIYDKVRSNIGRRKRAIAFFAWRSFFAKGPSRSDYPLNWRDGEIGS